MEVNSFAQQLRLQVHPRRIGQGIRRVSILWDLVQDQKPIPNVKAQQNHHFTRFHTLPETKTSSPLKMDGWNTILSYWGPRPIFRGKLTVSFREGNISDSVSQQLFSGTSVHQESPGSTPGSETQRFWSWEIACTWLEKVMFICYFLIKKIKMGQKTRQSASLRRDLYLHICHVARCWCSFNNGGGPAPKQSTLGCELCDVCMNKPGT